jgi:hypothetical protein
MFPRAKGFALLGVTLLLGVTIFASPVFADGFRNPFQDSNAAAQGLAFTA